MNSVKNVLICLLIALFSFSTAYGQSKKKLREQIADLETEVATLTQENIQMEQVNERLRQENQAYVEQNSTLRSQVGQLQRENDALRVDNQALETENETLEQRVEALAGGPISTGGIGTGTTTGGTTGGGLVSDPNDTRKCAYFQGRLTPGVSYTETYEAISNDGWGIQVYASSNLCQAAEKAESFKKNYRLYKTYVRCKQVGSGYVYAVIYGTLKYEDQAKTYLRNFKKLPNNQWGANAFLVQH
jgi:cell division protein FtsB